MSSTFPDVIDALVGIRSGEPLDHMRAQRPDARAHAQAAFEALFAPVDESQMSLVERHAVAAFVADLHKVPVVVEFYSAVLHDDPDVPPALVEVVLNEARIAVSEGPYGAFRGENAPESTSGPEYAMTSFEGALILGDRLAAALEHAHMLVLHPRDASRAHLQRLLDAGWSTPGIVTLSQLIAFLSFQIRVVVGLTALGRTTTRAPAEEMSR